jgi:hypothetical protein
VPSTPIPVALRAQVREIDSKLCAYCHTPEALTVATFEVDHIVPVSQGGETSLDNLCLSCPSCNRHKGARQAVSDPETGESVPLYHPRHQVWTEHFAWSDDSTRLAGLTVVGRTTIEALQFNRPQMTRLRGLWITLELFPPK